MITLHKDLKKHAAEFLRAIRNLKFERTEIGGLYFPAQRAIAHGMYVHDVNGMDVRYDPNLLPTEGLTHMLATELGAGTQITAWYLALYSGNVSPAASWTAANFTANATEITSNTEGYSETTRRAFTPAAAAAASINNLASKAQFTIATATSVGIWGCALLSDSAKGGTSGKLVSASKFASQRTLSDADLFNLGYTVSLTSS